jgi:hypothetical protein
MRFREDIHPPSTPNLIDDSLLLSESNHIFFEPPSPQINNQNNSMKNRQRHDSVKRFLNENRNFHFFFFFLGYFLCTCNALWIKIC